MLDETQPGPSRDDDHVTRSILGDERILALAQCLVASFSPSHSLVTSDLLNEALLRIYRSDGKRPDWDDPEQFRPFVFIVMKNLLHDRQRKQKEARLGDSDDAVAEPGRVDLGRIVDVIAAFVELQRTTDPNLRKCFEAYSKYRFLKFQGRFSREGHELLSTYDENVRTMAQVARMCGITPSAVHYRVARIERWLEGRLRAYREELPSHGTTGTEEEAS